MNQNACFRKKVLIMQYKDSFYAKYIKRALDFSISLVAVIILLPVFLLLTVIGAAAMKGNPFFTQERPGRIVKKSGVESRFRLIKFRTMTNEKDSDGKLLPDDKRMKKYGKFLRSTSLDELPELFNILIGNMSIVGPRPLLCEYLPYYTEEERHRHDVRPGLTGWAQVNGRNSVSWDRRFQYDVEYVENISLKFDLKIIIRTVSAVFHRSGVAEDTRQAEGNFAEIRKEALKRSNI